MNEKFVASVSSRYIELYENITGEKFEKADASDAVNRIEANIRSFLDNQ